MPHLHSMATMSILVLEILSTIQNLRVSNRPICQLQLGQSLESLAFKAREDSIGRRDWAKDVEYTYEYTVLFFNIDCRLAIEIKLKIFLLEGRKHPTDPTPLWNRLSENTLKAFQAQRLSSERSKRS